MFIWWAIPIVVNLPCLIYLQGYNKKLATCPVQQLTLEKVRLPIKKGKPFVCLTYPEYTV